MIDNPNHKDDLEKSDPDPEGTHEQDGMEKATRRHFSADTKRRILQAYDACQEPGEKGALLRREGIYSSYITTWRRQQERGELGGLTTKKRGPNLAPSDSMASNRIPPAISWASSMMK
jgi:transposase-like protein